MRRIIPAKRNSLNGGSKWNCGRASRHDFQKRCSDRHRTSSAVHQKRMFALDGDVLAGLFPALHQDGRNRDASDDGAKGCRLAGIRPEPTAVLRRATHERALIGHGEPDSGPSHAASSGQSTGRSRLRQQRLINMPRPDRLPSIWLQRVLIDACEHANVDGRTVIVCSINSIRDRSERRSTPRHWQSFPRPGTRHGVNGDALCHHPATGP